MSNQTMTRSGTRTLGEVLTMPIRWQTYSSDQVVNDVLTDLQANILKGHGRDHTGNLFLSFAGMNPDGVALVLQRLAPKVTSALRQLNDAKNFKATGQPGDTVICLLLAAGTYKALSIPEVDWPQDAQFRAGMRASQKNLADPLPAQWDKVVWKPEITPDAMVLIADESPASVTRRLEEIEGLLNGTGAKVLGVERGRAWRRPQSTANPKGEGMENFGYADGRSQPLFLAEDVDSEAKEVWDPAFPPSQFILPDPAGVAGKSCGSYFVFRKLEQNVKGFKETEEKLASKMGLQAPHDERAGALVVGRFESGTPVVLHPFAQPGAPINDFDYSGDPDGELCPFRGHIRKSNPRGDSLRQFGKDLDPNKPDDLKTIEKIKSDERGRLMARRGITYGERRQQGDGNFAEDDRPEGGVGLLFMAYMAKIADQFEFTQASWVNNRDFVGSETGIDPVIGQGGTNPPQTGKQIEWSDGYSNPPKTASLDFQGFVKLMGGDYFFAPSLSGLKKLSRHA